VIIGDPRKSRKKWERPGHPWIKARLEEEMRLLGAYGLRNLCHFTSKGDIALNI
jgi:hypothetical protein